MDATDRRLWEIAENLHRCELTVQERADHIAEWVSLTAEREGAQLAPPGGRQPHSKGIKAAVSELGIDRTQAQRAVKIASITEEAKEAARDVGSDQIRSCAPPFNRTPGPPATSSPSARKMTPADSRAVQMASRVTIRGDVFSASN